MEKLLANILLLKNQQKLPNVPQTFDNLHRGESRQSRVQMKTFHNENIKVRLKTEAITEPSNRRMPSNHFNFHNSLQGPLSYHTTKNGQERSNLSINTLTPKINKNTLNVGDVRIRQKSILSSNSNNTNNSKCKKNSVHAERQLIQSLELTLDDNKLSKRLTMFSKQQGKSSIRVYKEDIHKIIVQRYNKDRITTFLDTQYIQDFESIKKTMQELLKLKIQEIYLFVFLIIDQNRDGIITPDDLTNLIGAKRQSFSPFNRLVTADVTKIIRYVEKAQKRGEEVMDQCSNSVLKDESLTFMKYRIDNYRRKKNQEKSKEKKSVLVSSRLHEHLYTLKNHEQEQNMNRMEYKVSIASYILSLFGKKKGASQVCFFNKGHFSINFDRFCSIFCNQVPKIYIDFLYLLGGVEMPGEQYLQIDNSVLAQKQRSIKTEVVQQNKMMLTQRRLKAMNVFKKQLRTLKLSKK